MKFVFLFLATFGIAASTYASSMISINPGSTLIFLKDYLIKINPKENVIVKDTGFQGDEYECALTVLDATGLKLNKEILIKKDQVLTFSNTVNKSGRTCGSTGYVQESALQTEAGNFLFIECNRKCAGSETNYINYNYEVTISGLAFALDNIAKLNLKPGDPF